MKSTMKSITKRIGILSLAVILLFTFAGQLDVYAYTDEDGDRWYALDENGYELDTTLSQDGKWLYSEYKDGIMVSSDRTDSSDNANSTDGMDNADGTDSANDADGADNGDSSDNTDTTVCEIPAYIDGKKVVAVCGENYHIKGGGGFGELSSEADEIILPATVHTLLPNTVCTFEKDKKVAVPPSVTTLVNASLNQYHDYKLTVVCVEDSAAHQYAVEHNLQVELVDDTYFPEPEVIAYEPPKKGDVIHDGQGIARYIVTNAAKKEVSYKEPIRKTEKSITVPATVKVAGITYKVTGISANAFKDCKKLKTLTIKTTKLTKKTVFKNAFKGLTKKTTIKVPKKKLASYKKIFKSKGLSSKVRVTK